MSIFCYGITYLFEQFISYQYFNNKFEKRKNKNVVFLIFLSAFVLQFIVSFFNAPYLNLIAFFITNLFVSIFCFDIKWKQCIFNVILLTSIMISTELFAMYSFTTILKIDLLECKNNDLVLFFETFSTKALYFLVSYLFSKFANKEKNIVKDYSIFLFILPASSVITTASFAYLSFKLEIEHSTNVVFLAVSLILLISNIAIFFIHEKIINTLIKNAELQLENQKKEINTEYYNELERQYDISNILIHDIKKCLLNIKILSSEGESSEVIKYVDSIYEGYEINAIKQYSKNKLVNVIISRYSRLCKNKNIKLSVDIRDINFSFITDSDLTAILDNLLENSYEASIQASNKEISLTIDKRNESYMLIKLSNYSDFVPKIVDNYIISTKDNKKAHGIGTRSIAKIVKKYNGNIEYRYSNDTKKFSATILLKMN